jgi:hypothetical protein
LASLVLTAWVAGRGDEKSGADSYPPAAEHAAERDQEDRAAGEEFCVFEEAAMMPHTTVQALGQVRLADLHDQARR